MKPRVGYTGGTEIAEARHSCATSGPAPLARRRRQFQPDSEPANSQSLTVNDLRSQPDGILGRDHQNIGPRLPRSLVRNHAQSIVACAFLVVITARFRTLSVFLLLELGTRRILHRK